MKSVGDVMARMAERADEKLTPHQREIVADYIEVAHGWNRGDLPLMSARDLTGGARGYQRWQVSRLMVGDSPDAVVWRAFIIALDDANNADCTKGGFDGKGYHISIRQLNDVGGWVEQEYDEHGDLRCMARFPHVNLAKTPKMSATAQSSKTDEWFKD